MGEFASEDAGVRASVLTLMGDGPAGKKVPLRCRVRLLAAVAAAVLSV